MTDQDRAPEPLTVDLPQASERLGRAFTVQYLRTQLRAGGLLEGLGLRKNNRPTGEWIIPVEQLAEIVDRHRRAGDDAQVLDEQPPVYPSGLSRHSRSRRAS